MTAKELSSKEVICISDGKRLGYICDIEFTKDCCLSAFLLPDNRFFALSGRPKYRVLLDWVEKIGSDLILVRRYEQICCEKKKKDDQNVCCRRDL